MQRSTASLATSIVGLEESTDRQSDEIKTKESRAVDADKKTDTETIARAKRDKRARHDEMLSIANFREIKVDPPKKGSPKIDSKVDLSSLSTDLKMWDERYDSYILKAVIEKNVKMLKFILGPSFVSIRNRDWNVEYPKSEWEFFNETLKFEFYSKLSEILSIWTPLLQNEMIISNAQDAKLREQEQPIPAKDDEDIENNENIEKRFSELVESHNEAKSDIKSSGIEGYSQWMKKYASSIQSCRRGLFSSSKTNALLVEDINITLTQSVKIEIENLFNTFVLPHVEEQTKKLFSTKDGFDLPSYVKSICKKLLDDLICHAPNLLILKANTKLEQSKFNIEAKYDELSESAKNKITTYEEEKSKIEKAYKSFATDWLKENYKKDHKNEEKVSELFCTDKNGWKGADSHEALIDMFIKYKSFANTSRSPNQRIKNLFAEIETIDDVTIRTEFVTLMEEHWNSPRLEEVTNGTAVAKIQQKRFDYKKCVPVDKFSQKIVDAPQKSDSQCWLEPEIKKPLEWHKLTLLLEALPCYNERQLILKKELLSYLKTKIIPYDIFSPIRSARSFVSRYPDFDYSEHRRREVEYLTGCLYLASAKGQDKGCLYDLDNYGLSIGVTYILELVPSETCQLRPRLQIILTEFLKKTDSDTPMLENVELKAISTLSSDKDLKMGKEVKKSTPPLYGKKIIGMSSVVVFGMFYPKTSDPTMVKEFHDGVKPADDFRSTTSEYATTDKHDRVHSVHR